MSMTPTVWERLPVVKNTLGDQSLILACSRSRITGLHQHTTILNTISMSQSNASASQCLFFVILPMSQFSAK